MPPSYLQFNSPNFLYIIQVSLAIRGDYVKISNREDGPNKTSI